MSSRFVRPILGAASRQLPRSATRSYAAAASVDTKPPIALFGVDGTYANALVRYLATSFIARVVDCIEVFHEHLTLGPLHTCPFLPVNSISPRCKRLTKSFNLLPVHCRRQILHLRISRQIPDLATLHPEIRSKTLPYPPRTDPDRIRQIIDRCRAGKAHRRRRQRRHRQELSADAGRKQPAWLAGGGL